jgi:D-alanyl-D-alanine carboxypeptidase/D-alanyl-D-alanine-endopeptidase (penicillin-binding protein 4)
MYAEHTLLMAGFQKWGTMHDGKIRENLLHDDFADLPQAPKWMDGSGLSRYNLFTPEDLVHILLKLTSIAGANRLKNIFPTGGMGTLKNNYLTKRGLIYAKTGSLRNTTCLSGFMETNKKKNIYFSIMVNNHTASGKSVRAAIEKMLLRIMEVY